MATPKVPMPTLPDLRLYITDTLGNPFAEEQYLPQMMQPVAKSRQDANAIKRGEPITVVIGNPPYKNQAKGRGGWVESGSKGRTAPMDWWTPPVEWGVSRDTKHLKNLYVYFWRWATWKVFGTGLNASTGLDDTDKAGIICFITAAGFLNGDAFQKMRDDLRRSCHEIWVIDCSPEGHQPEVPTRIFQDVQQPICIVLAARASKKDMAAPARVRFSVLPKGPRESKFVALGALSLEDEQWIDCPSGWRDPFLPNASGAWADYPTLDSFFSYNGLGVMPGRTWIISPDVPSLEMRWSALIAEKNATRKDLLFHPHPSGDKTVSKSSKAGLAGHEYRAQAVKEDQKTVITPIRYGFRSFDRQWIIPDARVINRPNPTLWSMYSSREVYLTALEKASPTSGPAISFSALIPDHDHFKGSFAGRVFPLWRDSGATESNVRPELLTLFAQTYGVAVTAEDVLAYIAAIMAHPAFTKRFTGDLVQPGLRLPITANAKLFAEAVLLGREVIWLHCYGERFAVPKAGRPKSAPRLPKEAAPVIPAGGAIPGAPEPLPDKMEYDAAKRRLLIGKGYIENVTPEMWTYEVSGKEVLWHWFSYRKRDRSRPIIGDRRPPSPLDKIQPEGWLPEYTTDLLDLLNVLGRLIAREPAQADLLARICDQPLISASDIHEALTPAPVEAETSKPKKKKKS